MKWDFSKDGSPNKRIGFIFVMIISMGIATSTISIASLNYYVIDSGITDMQYVWDVLVSVFCATLCLSVTFSVLRDEPEPKIEYVIPPKVNSTYTRSSAGFVYVIKELNQGHYKIGRTKNPYNRAKAFGVKLPFKIEFQILLETNDMYALESSLHSDFATKRVNGEWFALNSKDIQYIKGLGK